MGARRLVGWRAVGWAAMGCAALAACHRGRERPHPGDTGAGNSYADCVSQQFDMDDSTWSATLHFDQAPLTLIPATHFQGDAPNGRFISLILNTDPDHGYAGFNVDRGPSVTCIWVEAKAKPDTGYFGIYVSRERSDTIATMTWDKHKTEHREPKAEWRDLNGVAIVTDSAARVAANVGPWSTCASNGCCRPQ